MAMGEECLVDVLGLLDFLCVIYLFTTLTSLYPK